MCRHEPPCPVAEAKDHHAAKVVADRHEQGWVLLCNGIIRFDDDGELPPVPKYGNRESGGSDRRGRSVGNTSEMSAALGVA